MAEFKELEGKVLTEIINKDNDELIFICNSGEKYKMYHDQSGCEGVSIDDICGDLGDLIGVPILKAEEVDNNAFENDWMNGMSESEKNWQESYTWTFYKIATIKGYVDIRWFGESNGYYSESVDFIKSNKDGNYSRW